MDCPVLKVTSIYSIVDRHKAIGLAQSVKNDAGLSLKHIHALSLLL